MKKVVILLTMLLTLGSCQYLPSDIFPSSSDNSNGSNHSSSSDNSSSDNLNNSSSSDISSKPKEAVIDFYSVNDVHGRILEDEVDYVPGISKLSSYLKEEKEKNDDGFVFLNSGDYWQDTYDSGMNKGELLTKCLDVMECEVLTLGNHEFDWGIDVIKHNEQLVNYTSFLGANIYNYPNTNQKSEIGEEYKIIERSGLKIGIIGVIGQNQITSITSTYWEDLTFKNPTAIIKTLSDELRMEKDCDMVIVSIHADESDSDPYEITKKSPISGKRYVDAVFCGHSHQEEIKAYNGVPFIQGGDHGKQVSHVRLSYEDGEVQSILCKNEGYGKISLCEEDEEINAIIDSYFDEEYLDSKNEVIGTINASGGYISRKMVGRIQAKLTYDRLVELGYDEVDIVINNGGRDSGEAGTMTKEKIFNMTPFTNHTYVVNNIKGEDIIGECVEYDNPYYWADTNLDLQEDEYYTVACIDYLMVHKNTNRNYNYFRSYNKNNVEFILEEYPYEIIERQLKQEKSLNIYDFNTLNYTVL